MAVTELGADVEPEVDDDFDVEDMVESKLSLILAGRIEKRFNELSVRRETDPAVVIGFSGRLLVAATGNVGWAVVVAPETNHAALKFQFVIVDFDFQTSQTTVRVNDR